MLKRRKKLQKRRVKIKNNNKIKNHWFLTFYQFWTKKIGMESFRPLRQFYKNHLI